MVALTPWAPKNVAIVGSLPRAKDLALIGQKSLPVARVSESHLLLHRSLPPFLTVLVFSEVSCRKGPSVAVEGEGKEAWVRGVCVHFGGFIGSLQWQWQP